MTIAARVLERAAATPARTAVAMGDRVLTYADLAADVDGVASALAPHTGGRVGLLLPSGPTLLATFLGAARAGAAAVVLQPGWGDVELTAAVADAAPDVVVTTPALAPRLAGPADTRPLIVLDDEEGLDGLRPAPTSGAPTSALPASGVATSAVAADRPMLVAFTSGTTGRPRGIVRSHASWTASVAACAPFGVTADDEVAVPGPLHHTLSLFAAVHALHVGAAVHLLPAADPRALLDLVRTRRATCLYAVPTVLTALLDLLDRRGGGPLPWVRRVISSGAAWPEHGLDAVARHLPAARTIDFYGASELSFVAWRHVAPGDPPGLVGRPFDEVEVAVRDADGRPVPAGEAGVLWVRSPLTADGYLQPSRDGAGPDPDGWITVGDVVRRRPDGSLLLEGRTDTMLVTGGHNVHAERVERLLEAHPDVAEAVVVGLPDRLRGQVVCAVVRPADRDPPTRRGLADHLAPHLSRALWPRRWYALPELPRTASGKPARRAVADLVAGSGLAGRELR